MFEIGQKSRLTTSAETQSAAAACSANPIDRIVAKSVEKALIIDKPLKDYLSGDSGSELMVGSYNGAAQSPY